MHGVNRVDFYDVLSLRVEVSGSNGMLFPQVLNSIVVRFCEKALLLSVRLMVVKLLAIDFSYLWLRTFFCEFPTKWSAWINGGQMDRREFLSVAGAVGLVVAATSVCADACIACADDCKKIAA